LHLITGRHRFRMDDTDRFATDIEMGILPAISSTYKAETLVWPPGLK
jgi:hypothetical protein